MWSICPVNRRSWFVRSCTYVFHPMIVCPVRSSFLVSFGSEMLLFYYLLLSARAHGEIICNGRIYFLSCDSACVNGRAALTGLHSSDCSNFLTFTHRSSTVDPHPSINHLDSDLPVTKLACRRIKGELYSLFGGRGGCFERFNFISMDLDQI
ncbi:hypothetical protein BKA82DRAFT_920159 [Pisolithus tinctorius]|uniref:Uncharacterized protein n=1 Tax=Pisolithus tinctorius Marx 270 TaxID=870435 RepID=A0A0C3IJ79_PISTI|nr:hypothetical protein BKA82DRAFT_920159 [Pisolithus tinctorius]KIN97047.1 hypothetical protein M404DRAFT_920159 [Pisolithus tinctorius Marx 270]